MFYNETIKSKVSERRGNRDDWFRKNGSKFSVNMQREGFRVVGTDLNEACRQTIQAQGIETADSLTSLLATLPQQRLFG